MLRRKSKITSLTALETGVDRSLDIISGSSKLSENSALRPSTVPAPASPTGADGHFPAVFQKLCVSFVKRTARRSAVARQCRVVPQVERKGAGASVELNLGTILNVSWLLKRNPITERKRRIFSRNLSGRQDDRFSEQRVKDGPLQCLRSMRSNSKTVILRC